MQTWFAANGRSYTGGFAANGRSYAGGFAANGRSYAGGSRDVEGPK
jgi:hypothetical protein